MKNQIVTIHNKVIKKQIAIGNIVFNSLTITFVDENDQVQFARINEITHIIPMS